MSERGVQAGPRISAVCLLFILTFATPAHGVVGGAPVDETSVPWFASLWHCGGILVAPDRVLTAGHCVRGASPWDLDSIRVAGTVRRGVRFAMHPSWRRTNGGNVLEDVALIQLDAPVLGVPPVTLGGPLPDRARVIGRGYTIAPLRGEWVPRDRGSRRQDDPLHGAELRPITDDQCARDYRRRRGNDGERFYAPRMLCATDINGRPPLSSSCYGDSGGPFFSGLTGAPVIHGIVSWGGARCGADRLPDVFASVKRARAFIVARNPAWAPVPDGPPVISGRARPGSRLSCAVPSWSVAPTRVHVRWARSDWWDIDEPVGHRRTYTVRRRDAGRTLSCSVRASNAGGLVAAERGPASWVRVPR